MTIKLTDEQIKKYGVTTQEELLALLDKQSAPAPVIPPAAQTPPAPVQALNTSHLEGLRSDFIGAITAVKTELTASIAGVVEKATTAAKAEASKEVSAAIAKSGGQAIGSKGAVVDPPATGAQATDPNDFGAQYDADAKIREEFVGGRNSYIKFKQGAANGRIRVHNARN